MTAAMKESKYEMQGADTVNVENPRVPKQVGAR